MANHKSALKRIRQTESRRVENKYYAKTTRNAVKKLRSTTEKEAAVAQYSEVSSMLDKLAKKDVIHKNKASNLKSKLSHYINTLS
jgi:small subunit ribosomal protein S20